MERERERDKKNLDRRGRRERIEPLSGSISYLHA
jgi:hypothetical protein